jgi:large subunit ribosomal protein L24
MFGAKRQSDKPAPRKTHVRKNDQVVVLAGKDRGKHGKVLKVIASKGTAIVERVNFAKKHTKKDPGKKQQGGVLEREAPIRVDNLQVVCPACSKPTRVGSHLSEGANVRICKKCEAELG